MNLNSNIYIAGHNGLVGSALIRQLSNLGYKNLITRNKSELDLRNQMDVESFFKKEQIDYVFNAAAKVGGIYANDNFSADFIYDNIQIQTNLIHFSYKYNVKKFLMLGSICIFPKFADNPVKEESLLTGFLEPTNEAYAIAKISGIKMCQMYYKQYGFNSVSIMPSNLYGINDNFHPDLGHVIPAMFTKFSRAKESVTFWGTGTALREFLYCDDMADACIFLMNSDLHKGEIINAGYGRDYSIREIANMISDIFGYKGEILWDLSKPDGTPKRLLDSTKINTMGWKPKFSLEEGLQKTYEYYMAK